MILLEVTYHFSDASVFHDILCFININHLVM